MSTWPQLLVEREKVSWRWGGAAKSPRGLYGWGGFDFNDNGGDHGATGEELGESLGRGPENLEENLGARLPNATKSLEGGDVGWKFQFKIAEFMDSMTQKLKHGKDERACQHKMIKLFMMQGARPSFLTKKLAKVNMSSTFLGVCKAKKVKKIILEMDNYYNVQRPKKDDKVSIAETFFKDHALQWWRAKNNKNPSSQPTWLVSQSSLTP